jgi:hypothetical protein
VTSSSDTLSAFLREMRASYPEIGAMSGIEPASEEKSADATPKSTPKSTLKSAPKAAARATTPEQSRGSGDSMPTGSILPDRARLRR